VGIALGLCFIVPWLAWGGGVDFLRHYWADSVTGRLHATQPGAWMFPLRTLAETYWPWLPFLLWGALEKFSLRGPLGLARLQCACILGAFMKTGHMYEHYLVPFYPFASVLAAAPLARRGEAWAATTVKAVRYTALGALALSLVLPFRLRHLRTDPIREAAPAAASRCARGEVREVLVSEGLAEKWLALATTLWETPWEATSIRPAEAATGTGKVLLAAPGDRIASHWEALPVDPGAPYRLYQPRGTHYCD
jgi:hypothetical protein